MFLIFIGCTSCPSRTVDVHRLINDALNMTRDSINKNQRHIIEGQIGDHPWMTTSSNFPSSLYSCRPCPSSMQCDGEGDGVTVPLGYQALLIPVIISLSE
jgi:hypothetical protein